MPDFSRLAIEVPEVLLPAPWVDLSRWAVVACDQYTSQADYWARVEKRVGDSPSSFHLILPEVFLSEGGEDARIESIQAHMREYLDTGVFGPPVRSFVYLERSTPRVACRRGLVVALDLEHYDYREGARSLVRASESTVGERLPARMRVRRGAPLELPHAVVLFDDPDGRVMDPLAAQLGETAPFYDAHLMQGGGQVRGWKVERQKDLAAIHAALAQLAKPETYWNRYGVDDSDVLLFAVGDGNHSLAAAKALWEEIKADLDSGAASTHPARHALVELVNLHDPGVTFEPIHRAVFGVDPEVLLAALVDWFSAQGSACTQDSVADEAAMQARLADLAREPDAPHALAYVAGRKLGVIEIEQPKATLPVESLQGFLDAYTAEHSDARVDSIHGEDPLRSLCAKRWRIGFLLPPLPKSDLFPRIVRSGALPPKTFSLGEADEKRFYMEARRIIPS